MSRPRIREAGDSALVLELDAVVDPQINARVIAAASAVRRAAPAGVRDVVPTFRSVAVYFDPLEAEVEAVRAALSGALEAPAEPIQGRSIDVPIVYGGAGGPDLEAVATWAGLRAEEVAERHAGLTYRVFMLGFLPGFAYLGSVDERIAAPRRATPRLRVRGGSVGIAGRQTGIYPRDSPGGWQIIGHTALPVFDTRKAPPALFHPGDNVRFVMTPASVDDRPGDQVAPHVPHAADLRPGEGRTGARTVTVLRPGLFTTIQDEGRWGHQAHGVPVSGALDRVSHRTANIAVGNTIDAATLEVTLAGLELRVEQSTRLAVAGADLQGSLDGVTIRLGESTACRAGSVLRFGERRSGARAYVAFDGGIDVEPVLGSRSTHAGAALGGLAGRALVAGDRLPLGAPVVHRPARKIDVVPAVMAGGATLRVLPGPQDDFFPESAFDLLERTRFMVTPRSDRMGYRLSGASLPRIEGREMISDAAFTGGIQVPPSGEPILLMSDRQTTGGYPQIATVITADLPIAGQLAPGDWVEFKRCTMTVAVAALRAQEEMLGAAR